MMIFLDTEFTSLVAPSNLISIALVSEDDRYFYCELSDGWSPDDCTPWVQDNVLAKLDDNPETTMSRVEAAERIRHFLSGIPEPVVCFDSEHDERQLLGLLGALPAGVRLQNINSEVEQAVFEGYFGGAAGSLQHHALVDARALEYSYRVTREMQLRAMQDRDDVC